MGVSNNGAIRESAAFLFAWSVFALVEGTIRMVLNSKPEVGVDYFTNENADGQGIIPVAVLLAAGIAEVIFAMGGLYLSLFSILLNQNNATVTLGYMIMQAVLGWFVFLTFVVAEPIINTINAQGNDLLSKTEQKSLILMGNMLASISFCWALQGGMFVMAMRLWKAQKGEPDVPAGNAMRAKVWSGNMIASAISTLYVGSLLASKGFTSTTAPVGAPPHVVWFPAISLVTGVIMLFYGILGFLAAGNAQMATHFPTMFLITCTAMMVNFSWTFGIVPGLAPPIPGAAQHLGLILSMTLLPLFHVHRAHVSVSEETDGKEAPAYKDEKYEDQSSARA